MGRNGFSGHLHRSLRFALDHKIGKRKELMTTVAVEKHDEKPEKRKALGRGLASLLPGPRV